MNALLDALRQGRLRMWKRNGDYGVYVVELIEEPSTTGGKRAKIRLCYHTWVRVLMDGARTTRWVAARRLLPLEPRERERPLREGLPA